VDEFSLIYDLIAPAAGARSDVVLGIGDDGALLRPPGDDVLVAVVDTLVEGVHFPVGFPPEDLGYRAVAVNFSDLAAMGAEPRWITLALTMPRADAGWLQAFMGGLRAACAPTGTALVGGDMTRGPLCVTVQALGSVPAGLALTRSGARPGDRIYVSGCLGDAAAGLAVLLDTAVDRASETCLVERFARPTPRLALGRALRGLATACIDVSDGLVGDIAHVARASGCAALLDIDAIPLSAALMAGRWSSGQRRDFALAGGDDYELCFTLPPDVGDARSPAWPSGVPVTRIGEMHPGPPAVLGRDASGRVVPLGSGYRHF
jgi:thiamine-monophosphate kinase